VSRQVGCALPTEEEDDAQKLLYFESLFFKMDPDGDGSITFEEAGRLLAFTALDMSAAQREACLKEIDDEGDGDGELDREEFIVLCAKTMWDTPRSTLEMASENFADFCRMKDNRISAKWRRVANNIDRFCRVWVPLIYVCVLLIIYSIEFDDQYTDDTQKMFKSLGSKEDYVTPGAGWETKKPKNKWFVPKITFGPWVRRMTFFWTTVEYSFIIIGFALAFTACALLLIGSWIALRAWLARRFDEAVVVAESAAEVVRNRAESLMGGGENSRLSRLSGAGAPWGRSAPPADRSLLGTNGAKTHPVASTEASGNV